MHNTSTEITNHAEATTEKPRAKTQRFYFMFARCSGQRHPQPPHRPHTRSRAPNPLRSQASKSATLSLRGLAGAPTEKDGVGAMWGPRRRLLFPLWALRRVRIDVLSSRSKSDSWRRSLVSTIMMMERALGPGVGRLREEEGGRPDGREEMRARTGS